MKVSTKRPVLFLTELIISLLFFSVCATICATLLIQSYSMSKDSKNLTNAVYEVQTVVEEWKAGDIKQEKLANMTSFEDTNTTFIKLFDKHWLPILSMQQEDLELATYALLLFENTNSDNLITIEVQVIDSYLGEEIFSLTSSKVNEEEIL